MRGDARSTCRTLSARCRVDASFRRNVHLGRTARRDRHDEPVGARDRTQDRVRAGRAVLRRCRETQLPAPELRHRAAGAHSRRHRDARRTLADTGLTRMLRLWGRLSSINVRKVAWTLRELNLAYERLEA